MPEQAKKILKDSFPEMVKVLKETIKFNTVEKPSEGIYPFGKETGDCLDYVLSVGEKMGFRADNIDYYAGQLDCGNGKEVLGILGHLDVVPVSKDGWIAPPFAGEVIDGKMYGRGTVDDKGPMIACMFALKALMDSGFKPSKTIRLIFGCNEETGMKCMQYYKTKRKMPDVAFSPDGNFPLINCEKGVYGIKLDAGILPDEVIDIAAGSLVNIVPNYCEAVVAGKVDVALDNVTAEFDGTNTKLTATGKATHGSVPELGDNATWKIFKALAKLFPQSKPLTFIANNLCVDFCGEKWGLYLEDKQSGKISVSLDVVKVIDRHLQLDIDIRFPVSYSHAKIEELIHKNSPDFKIIGGHKSASVYISPDSPLVKDLLAAYKEVMGGDPKPMAIGGGTYAKCMDNCLAFGPEFADDEKIMHQTNEYISLDKFAKMAEIYLVAIYNLAR
ncbi:MAG: Sapep family Mn(2+)-dependent dipeptidase [Clostridia bacterium]|nr:Sapep family Mn(2+)-dependent dipeptidase [Clostridia bacterium]